MQKEELYELKSGTDVRGVAVGGVRGKITLTDEATELICRAFAAKLISRTGKSKVKIAIGHDPRISSPRVYAAAERAILSCGCDVLLTGLCSTPSMFMLLKKPGYGCDGSIMITASHLPYERNGLKFFTPDGGLDSSEIDELLQAAAEGNFPSGSGKSDSRSFIDEYSADLVRFIRSSAGSEKPLAGKRIIVDAGNGSGGFFCDRVLVPLGADVTGSQFLEPDGTFPNHIPNPEDKKAIDSLGAAVKKYSADFGIIFDTDVDRAACVDKNGEEINRNRLIALISAILLAEKAGAIVTDSVASDHLTEFIESRGGTHIRYKRGYKNVIDKCRELNARGVYSPLAIETSGHAALKENFFLDDGAYLITRLLISLSSLSAQGRELSDLIADLKQPADEREIRLAFNEKSRDFRTEGDRVIKELKAVKAEGVSVADDNYEGVRLRFDKTHGDGWLLVRMSVHDPVMPINFESDSADGVAAMAEFLRKQFEKYDFLDCKKLMDLCG